MFKVNSFVESNLFRLDVHGVLDMATVDSLEEVFQSCDFSNTDSVVINLEHLSMIDSTGIGSLLNLYNISKEHGSSFQVLNINEDIREIFSIIGVEELFE